MCQEMPAVVLTVNVCWGHGECEGLCQPRFQSPLWELCKVGWEIPVCEQAASWLFPCARQPLSSHCCPCAALLEINPLLLQGAGKSSALPWVMD